jgi:alkylation response protein AidB-like acyl-CoA dehydrogenase
MAGTRSLSATMSDADLLAELVRRTEALTPAIRSRSAEAEAQRRMPDATMAEAEAAELLEIMVPRRFGGHGLGIEALCRVTRAFAHGDASTAWVMSFLISHNWMLCRMGMDLQEEILAERPYARAAASLIPSGQAIRVDGGFRVTGRWTYCSGAPNSDYTFISAPVTEGGENVPYVFLLPHGSVTLNDDWHFTGMAATGSISIAATDLFLPERYAVRADIYFSADRHPGAAHVEPIYRSPLLVSLFVMVASIAIGAAESVIELGRARLGESKFFGHRRLDREQSRARWAEAHQKVRCAELLWEKVITETDRKCVAGELWSIEEEGQFGLDIVTVGHLCLQAVRLIMDGVGTSAYDLSNPLPRYLRDMEVMMSWPGMDWDIVTERGARWVLGLGRAEHDPFSAAG